jgi:ribosomal protein S18 acetylase RimI-like enzyme|tara:strand:+ start:271 stop:747 length:477 start_codon:yes stop_codon:yes gene_type:complete
MSNIQWMYGEEPKNLPIDLKERIRTLFLNETGEEYTLESLSNLPIPKWSGNMLLIDQQQYPAPESILGVLWALPHEVNGVRIAAFVLEGRHQSCGWGGNAWEHLIAISRSMGKTTIQLEVKAENTRAQGFYKSRGLEVVRHIPHYYKSGVGYEMKGPL